MRTKKKKKITLKKAKKKICGYQISPQSVCMHFFLNYGSVFRDFFCFFCFAQEGW